MRKFWKFKLLGAPGDSHARETAGIAHISKMFARYGVTSVHHEGGSLPAMQKVRSNEELKHRISYEANGKELDAMIAAGLQSGFGDEWIRFGATAEHTQRLRLAAEQHVHRQATEAKLRPAAIHRISAIKCIIAWSARRTEIFV